MMKTARVKSFDEICELWGKVVDLADELDRVINTELAYDYIPERFNEQVQELGGSVADMKLDVGWVKRWLDDELAGLTGGEKRR